jgi:RND family efflux transporter MFP subunit
MMSIIRKFLTVFVTVAIVAGFVGFIGFMGSMRPKPEKVDVVVTPPAVFYEVVAPESVTLDVAAQGEVKPRTEINLTSQVGGRIVRTSTEFLDGGAFNKGDLLIKIEDAEYRAALANARAQLAQAEQALKLEEAEAALAQRDYAELGQNEDPSDLALRKPQLAQAQANFEAAKARVRSAQIDLDRTEIRAPFQGRVRSRNAGEGQFVSPGVQLGRIFSTDVAEIRLPLTDSDLAKLGLPISFVEGEDRQGPPVELSAVVAGQMHKWIGRIARTDGAIDATTRQISAIAVVDDPYGEGAAEETDMPLAIGLFVEAHIRGRPFDDAFVLPRSALYGRDTIYVISSEETLEEHKVTVVTSDRDTVTVTAGLSEGERVVTSPLRGAVAGDKVTPTDPESVGSENSSASTIANAGSGGAK